MQRGLIAQDPVGDRGGQRSDEAGVVGEPRTLVRVGHVGGLDQHGRHLRQAQHVVVVAAAPTPGAQLGAALGPEPVTERGPDPPAEHVGGPRADRVIDLGAGQAAGRGGVVVDRDERVDLASVGEPVPVAGVEGSVLRPGHQDLHALVPEQIPDPACEVEVHGLLADHGARVGRAGDDQPADERGHGQERADLVPPAHLPPPSFCLVTGISSAHGHRSGPPRSTPLESPRG